MIDSEEVTLSSSRKILTIWKQLLAANKNIEAENDELKNVKEELIEEMKQKLECIEELMEFRQVKTFSFATQTPRN